MIAKMQVKSVDFEAKEGYELMKLELFMITKGLHNWNDLYDVALRLLAGTRDQRLKKSVSRKLESWGDRRIPRLLELKRTHFLGEPDRRIEGRTNYLAMDLETPEKREIVLSEVNMILGELMRLVIKLDKDMDFLNVENA
jgi:hypothetical protein